MAYFDSRRGSFGQPGFDVIFVESLLSLASIDRDPAFNFERSGARCGSFDGQSPRTRMIS